MKKILVSCLLLIPAWGIAQEPTEQEIRKAAINYMAIFTDGQYKQISKIYSNAIENGSTTFSDESLANVLEFKGGGWILMSNDYKIQPVLAYSEFGTWNPDTAQMPPSLVTLLFENLYQINLAKLYTVPKGSPIESFYQENHAKWQDLQSLNSPYSRSLVQSKTNGVKNLLIDENGAPIQWSQEGEYNKFAPKKDEFVWGCLSPQKNCSDDEKPIGCGPVAMGQIMKHLKYPPQYDWDRMPFALSYLNSEQEINNIAHLLKTCGDAACVVYCCGGSWSTTNKVQDALLSMNLSSTKKLVRRGKSDSEWSDIIKQQLNNGFPVLYRGDKNILSTEKHFWVVSGYNSDNLFYCNWGWGYADGFFSLNDLTPETSSGERDYRKNNMILYDIIPNWDITSSCTLSNITKGNNEELRSFCGTATLNNITLTGNSQSKIAFTQELIINGPLTVSGGATLTLACYDKERSAYLQSAKSKSEKGLESGQKGENVPETVQTEDLNASDELSELFVLSPNPARNEVRIALSSYDFGIDKKDVMIFDSRGHLRYQTQFSESTCTIPLSRFETGLYFVRVICGEFIDTQKLIVQ